MRIQCYDRVHETVVENRHFSYLTYIRRRKTASTRIRIVMISVLDLSCYIYNSFVSIVSIFYHCIAYARCHALFSCMFVA